MKKYFKLSAVLLISFLTSAILSGCFMGGGGGPLWPTIDPSATPSPQERIDKEYILYDNGDGFSIYYHKDWSIIHENNKNNNEEENINNPQNLNEILEVTISSYNLKTPRNTDGDIFNQKINPAISIVKNEIKEENFNLEEYTEKQISNLRENLPNFTILKTAQASDFTITELGEIYDATVKGHLYDENNNPLGGITVILRSESNSGEDKDDNKAITDANGLYEFKNIPVGSYSLFILDKDEKEIESGLSLELTGGLTVVLEFKFDNETLTANIVDSVPGENKMNGIDAYEYIYTASIFSVSNTVSKQVITYNKEDNCVYIISYVCMFEDYERYYSEDKENNYDAVADKMIKSFTFK